MNGGSNIVGLRPGQPYEDEGQHGTFEEVESPSPFNDSGRGRAVIAAGLLVLGITWLAFVIAGAAGALPANVEFREVLTLGACISAPLILLATLHLLFVRGSRVETRRMAATTELLRVEQRRLSDSIEDATRRLNRQAHEIVDTRDALVTVAEDAALRFQGVGEALAQDLVELQRFAATLAEATGRAASDVGAITAAMPQARIVTEELVDSLGRVGDNAVTRIEDLDRRLDALAGRGHEADAVVAEAGRRLGDELERLTVASDDAKASLSAARVGLADDVDQLLAKARAVHEGARRDVAEQQRTIVELVSESERGLKQLGVEAREQVRAHVAELEIQLRALDALLVSQGDTSRAVLSGLADQLTTLDQRFEALDRGGEERARRLSGQLARLASEADGLSGHLETGWRSVERLAANAVEVRDDLDRLVEQIVSATPETLSQLERVRPATAQLAADAEQVRRLMGETAVLLDAQRIPLQEFIDRTHQLFSHNSDAAARLVAVIDQADLSARRLSQSAGSDLVEALVRVRETANAAAERAREALSSVIPRAAGELVEGAREALSNAVMPEVERQLRQLARTSEHALASANDATEQLEQRIARLSGAASGLDERLDEARSELETHGHDSFARRVALLMEALNSTAIDVGKLLSTEVTDTAWQAYLRGDRGVFTRRAVRLLDAHEARKIAAAYEEDGNFRDVVNRYIHDFEAMLRQVLATREASTLSVTLLSSDIGKLYVALAQAVERLRI